MSACACIYPALAVVPMGWSGAMWFIQRAHLFLVRDAGLPDDRLALGAWPFPPLVRPTDVAEI
eukprot:298177-Heterocapsa_arctica.AAC.1